MCHIKTLYSFQKYLQASLQVNQSEGELTEYGREGKGEGEGEGEKAVVQAMAHHHLRLILQFRVQLRFRPFRNCLNPELNHQSSSGQHLNLNLN